MLAEADGAWIAWSQTGRADGPPVVLVTGLGGAGSAWWRLAPHLAPHARTITLDNRGTGRSDRIGPRGVRMDDLVADVLAVLDDAGIAAAHLVGLSLGGMVAQRLALEHRDRVASLMLVATTATGLRGGPPWRLLAAGVARPALGLGRARPLVRRALYAAATAPGRIAQDLALAAEEPTPPWTAVAQLAVAARHDAAGRLHELAGLPVTVLHGEGDAVISPRRGEELAAGIPGARLVLLPGAGHVLTTDAEEAAAAAVVDHLGRAGSLAERGACTA